MSNDIHILSSAWKACITEQFRVVYALIMRELLTRFGTSRLGALKVFFEPMIPILLMLSMREFLGGLAPYGVDLLMFVSTGVLPYYLFRNCTSKVMSCVEANKALLFISEVKLFDAYLARIILEATIYFVMSVIIVAGLYFLGRPNAIPENILGVMHCMALAMLFGSGLGLCASALDALIPATKLVVNLVLRIGLLMSGVVFSLALVPIQYRHYITWNPMVHILERLRADYFVVYDPVVTVGHLSYPWIVTGFLWLIGLILIRRMRRWILQR